MGRTGNGAASDQLGQQACDSGRQVRISHPEIAGSGTPAGGLNPNVLLLPRDVRTLWAVGLVRLLLLLLLFFHLL